MTAQTMATSRFPAADRGRQMASPRPKTRDQGCAFNHDQTKGSSSDSSTKKFNADSPSFTPTQLQPGKKFTFSSHAANAAPFTPKATPSLMVQDTENNGGFNPAAIREFTPQSQNYDLNTTNVTNGVNSETNSTVFDPFGMSSMSSALPATQYNIYDDQNALATAGSYFQAQAGYSAPIQPLQYHLYAPIGPYRQDLTSYQRQAHDFFLPEDLRTDLQKKSEAARQVLPDSRIPTVQHYHSLVPLDTNPTPKGGGIFGYPSYVYKATSKKNGNIYCLRRLQGLRLNNKEAIKPLATWRRINNGNTVSVVECFTSRDWGDTSVIFIHNYHPLSKTLADHHFTSRGYGRQLPVAENILWSYICQICNALRAIHPEQLAARCIDATKVLLTDKDRIRLGACAIVDVLDYESNRSVIELQQEDFIHLGRLILSIGTNTPVLSNIQLSMEQFKRIYSRELSDRVVWLLTQPQAEQISQKTVFALAQGISSHILDSFDASLHADDHITTNLYRELENGRIARLLLKLGTINERPEYENEPNWSETGERYQLKLFRDYVFHQVDGATGNPVVDLGHMMSALNKLDAGIDEKVFLTSRDHQTSFVVTYRELKKEVMAAFSDLLKSGQKQAARGY